MSVLSTSDVLDHHLKCFVERDLDVVHLAARVHAHGCDLGLYHRLVHRCLEDLLDRGRSVPKDRH